MGLQKLDFYLIFCDDALQKIGIVVMTGMMKPQKSAVKAIVETQVTCFLGHCRNLDVRAIFAVPVEKFFRKDS